MATNKKPRKKYNKHAALQLAGDKANKNTFILSIIKLGKEGQKWFKNGVLQPNGSITKRDALLVLNTPRPWSFIFGLAYRNVQGQTFLRLEEVTLRNCHAYTSPKIVDFVDGEMQKIIENGAKDHILTPFFIACPEKRSFSDEEINALLNQFDVFGTLKTPHETKLLRDKGMETLRNIDPVPYCSKSTWTILRKNGIATFAELRLAGLDAISKMKGIGEKRCNELINGYRNLLSEIQSEDRAQDLIEFENQVYLHQTAMANLTR